MDTFQPLLLFLFLGLGMLVVFEIPEKQARFYFESRPFFLKSGVCVCVYLLSLWWFRYTALSGVHATYAQIRAFVLGHS